MYSFPPVYFFDLASCLARLSDKFGNSRLSGNSAATMIPVRCSIAVLLYPVSCFLKDRCTGRWNVAGKSLDENSSRRATLRRTKFDSVSNKKKLKNQATLDMEIEFREIHAGNFYRLARIGHLVRYTRARTNQVGRKFSHSS